MENLMQDIFVFDLDGTLVETDVANFYAYQDAVKEVLDVDIPLQNERFTRADIYKIFPDIPRRQYLDIVELKEQKFSQHLKDTVPNQKYIDLLKFEYNKGSKTILLTNSHKCRAMEVLQYYNLTGYFHEMYFKENYKEDKYTFVLPLLPINVSITFLDGIFGQVVYKKLK